jgi:iduronate 2-sulfatase
MRNNNSLMLSRRQFCTTTTLATAAAVLAAQNPRPKKKMNILFIAIDDLRPELGCYGAKHVHTPNLDALAKTGTVFTRAYCQQAVCSPSRTSLLTGLRPDTTKVYDLQTHFRLNLPDAVTLPQYFREQGYTTAGLSKIFHEGLDDSRSWSIPSWRPGDGPAWKSAESADAARNLDKTLRESNWKIGPPVSDAGPSYDSPDVADDALPDGQTANQAIAALRTLKDQLFFLAVGFLKPHLPFVAPKKYFDLYGDPKRIEMPDYPETPAQMPPWAGHSNGELKSYADIKEMPVPPERAGAGRGPTKWLRNKIAAAPLPAVPQWKARELVRAYYAAISYTDAQVGKVIAELDRLGLRENTAIVVFGDHGFHLNNHGLWHKQTVFEKATRSPLIASVPGQKRKGTTCTRLVEFVDIYPTLADIAGLKPPANLEGQSFRPLLDNPSAPGKIAALSQYPRTYEGKRLMGYSLRTERYRYTEWRVIGTTSATGEVLGRELYDYQQDPQESRNRAADPASRAVIEQLAIQLRTLVRT